MTFPSSIEDTSTPLVLDASVIINIVGTNIHSKILAALKRPIYIEETVYKEFTVDPRTGKSSESFLMEMCTHDLIKIVSLSDSQYETFIELTGAQPPDDLDDGEAASISYAYGLSEIAVDDRKAIRIIRENFPTLISHTTLDILCSQSVVSELGVKALSIAIQNARANARMGIPKKWRRIFAKCKFKCIQNICTI